MEKMKIVRKGDHPYAYNHGKYEPVIWYNNKINTIDNRKQWRKKFEKWVKEIGEKESEIIRKK